MLTKQIQLTFSPSSLKINRNHTVLTDDLFYGYELGDFIGKAEAYTQAKGPILDIDFKSSRFEQSKFEPKNKNMIANINISTNDDQVSTILDFLYFVGYVINEDELTDEI